MHTTTETTTAADLHAEYLAEGWEPGIPPGMRREGLAIDREVYAGADCPGCGGRGLEFLAYRKRSAYAGLASCRACGFGAEYSVS